MKTTNILIIILVILVFSFSFSAFLISTLTNPNTHKSLDNSIYVQTYLNSQPVDKQTLQQLQEQINKSSNTEGETSINSYNYEFLKQWQSKSTLSQAFDIIKNIPTEIVVSLGLNVNEYRIYINLFGWFIGLLIMLLIWYWIRGR